MLYLFGGLKAKKVLILLTIKINKTYEYLKNNELLNIFDEKQ